MREELAQAGEDLTQVCGTCEMCKDVHMHEYLGLVKEFHTKDSNTSLINIGCKLLKEKVSDFGVMLGMLELPHKNCFFINSNWTLRASSVLRTSHRPSRRTSQKHLMSRHKDFHPLATS